MLAWPTRPATTVMQLRSSVEGIGSHAATVQAAWALAGGDPHMTLCMRVHRSISCHSASRLCCTNRMAPSGSSLIHDLSVPHCKGRACRLHTRQRQLRKLIHPPLKNGLLIGTSRVIEDDCGRVRQPGFHHRNSRVPSIAADVSRWAVDDE